MGQRRNAHTIRTLIQTFIFFVDRLKAPVIVSKITCVQVGLEFFSGHFIAGITYKI